MIFLALSILCSTMIILIFRGFSTYNVNALQAIVFNYYVCLIFGIIVAPIEQIQLLPKWDGLPLTMFLGSLFIFLFYIIAKTTQLLGVAVASVAQKLSFIVPVISGILFFQEASTLLKYLGFALAIASVILISSNKNNRPKDGAGETIQLSKKLYILLPFIVFLGSGLCDLLINVIENKYIGEINTPAFTVVLFVMASLTGSILMLTQVFRGKMQLEAKNILAGVVLGIPNYGSIFFLMQSLNRSGLDSSQVFPINNVGIILLSVLSAWIFFNERLNFKQAFGLITAIATILILL